MASALDFACGCQFSGPELQDQLYKRHPANVIRLILNRQEPGDDERNNRYSRAAQFLKNWRSEGVLFAESRPAIYVYHQQFTTGGVPASPADDDLSAPPADDAALDEPAAAPEPAAPYVPRESAAARAVRAMGQAGRSASDAQLDEIRRAALSEATAQAQRDLEDASANGRG